MANLFKPFQSCLQFLSDQFVTPKLSLIVSAWFQYLYHNTYYHILITLSSVCKGQHNFIPTEYGNSNIIIIAFNLIHQRFSNKNFVLTYLPIKSALNKSVDLFD